MTDPPTFCCKIQTRFSARLRVWLSWIDALLWVEDDSGTFREMWFRVDCGAMLTRIPESVARDKRLPLASADPPLTLQEDSAAGMRPVLVRRGLLLVRFTPTQPSLPFPVPVHYVLTPPAHGPARPDPPSLLGLGGVVEQMSWHIDGRASDGDLDGPCLLTDTR